MMRTGFLKFVLQISLRGLVAELQLYSWLLHNKDKYQASS